MSSFFTKIKAPMRKLVTIWAMGEVSYLTWWITSHIEVSGTIRADVFSNVITTAITCFSMIVAWYFGTRSVQSAREG